MTVSPQCARFEDCPPRLIDCPRAQGLPHPPSADASDPNADVSALGYEQARDELVSVVARLEAGAQSLEESLALWERARRSPPAARSGWTGRGSG